MLFSSAAAVVAFVVFVAPGVVWAWLAERRRASLPRSTAVEGGLIAVTSVAFSLPALLLSYGVVWSVDRDLSSVDAWLRGETPTADRVAGAAAVLALLLGFSLLLVGAIYRTFGSKLLGTHRLSMVSAWADVLGRSCPEECEPVAEIRLKDGSVLRGVVGPHTLDHDLSDREVILGPPIIHEHDGASTYGLRPAPDRVVISGPDVMTFAVRYVARSDLDLARKAAVNGSASVARGGSAGGRSDLSAEDRASSDDRHDSMSRALD